jgi:hypothetical protein
VVDNTSAWKALLEGFVSRMEGIFMRTITQSQLKDLIDQAFERFDELLYPNDPEDARWPFYAPLEREKEEARCVEGACFAKGQIEKEPYRWLTIYICYYWIEWFILRERIDSVDQDDQDLRFLSELGLEVKMMEFQLDR